MKAWDLARYGLVAVTFITLILYGQARRELAHQRDVNAACRKCLIHAPCATPGICAEACSP